MKFPKWLQKIIGTPGDIPPAKVEVEATIEDVETETVADTKSRINLRNSDQPKGVPTVAEALAKTTDSYIQPVDTCKALMIKCPGCGHRHFRHAGYIETITPFVEAGGAGRAINDSHPVKICVKCKKAYAAIGSEHMYDVSKYVDVKAWEETEKTARLVCSRPAVLR